MDGRDGRIAAGLFVFLWAAAIATSHYGVVFSDEIVYFHTARAVALRGAADVPCFGMLEVRRGADGLCYGIYPPGWPAALAPAIAAGRALAAAAGRAPDSWDGRTVEIRVAFIWAAAVGAAGGVAPYVALRAVGAPASGALFAALAVALGTPSFYYARTLMSEPLRTGLAVAAVVPVVRLARGGGAGAAAGAGALLGAAALVRLDSVALWPAAALAGAAGLRRPATAAAFTVPLAGAAAILAAWNAARFGTPWTSGYEGLSWSAENLVEGVAAHLAGPGRGIVVFAPVAIAGVFGLKALDRPAAVYAAAGAILLAVLVSAGSGWRMAWDWGPRHLHTAWTLFGLGLAFASPRVAVPLAAWGLALNLVGSATDFTRGYDPAAFPATAQVRKIIAGRLDLPALRPWLLALGLLAAGALGLRRALVAAREGA